MLIKKIFVAGFIVGGLILFACEPREQHIDRIILITIDTLRADHLGCYGYPRDTSPFIDGLAREGILFQRAFASSATTAPSHASIFTSLYPLQHNVLKNGHVLDDSFITLAELLKQLDYTTVAFVSTNHHFRVGGMDQGFDVFNEPVEFYGLKYRMANETIDSAIDWIDEHNSSDRFFLWIHLFDPHSPYTPPERFLNAITNESLIFNFLLNDHHIDFDFYGNDSEKLLATINAYDGEILFADTEIQRLFRHVRKRGLDENSLWIITSDHGEGLGNHRWMEHGKHIYNEQIRIPLIFYFSSGSFRGLRVDDVVEQVDILPTVMELAGGEVYQIKSVEGSSLIPLFNAEEGGIFQKKYAFSQRRLYDEKRLEVIIPEKTNYEEGEKYAIQNKEYKYIYRTEGDDEFYDLREDPYELNNIVGHGSLREEEMKNMITLRVAQFKRNASGKPELVDNKTIEGLKALGYVP